MLGRTFSLGRLLFASLIATSFSGAAWGSFESGIYFPLVSGTTWSYRTNGSFNYTSTVLTGTTNINGVATKAVQDSSGFTNYYTNDSNGVRLHRQVDVSSGVTATFVPPMSIAAATTNVGQVANSGGTAVTNFGNFAYSSSFTITGFETVTVAIGRFDVVRVDGTVFIAGEPDTLTFYLAKNAGIVKSIETAVGETDTTELTARTIAVACPGSALQPAVDIGLPGEVITVAGPCSENVLIRNEKQRITIDGNGVASIAGTNSTTPALNIRGKGILVQGIRISGGSNGIEVNRGSNAVLNANIIENTGGTGIVVQQLAFAVLTGNQIENNPGAGILVSESSTARIGFNLDNDIFQSPNSLFNNGLGLVVVNGSSARVVGNNIMFNSGDGVWVGRDSAADISDNTIASNGGHGIRVSDNSAIQLGGDTGSSIFEWPNTGSGNTGAGIYCADGSVADGRIGTLTGLDGTTSFQTGCENSLIP